jgi:hypothetical protein
VVRDLWVIYVDGSIHRREHQHRSSVMKVGRELVLDLSLVSVVTEDCDQEIVHIGS